MSFFVPLFFPSACGCTDNTNDYGWLYYLYRERSLKKDILTFLIKIHFACTVRDEKVNQQKVNSFREDVIMWIGLAAVGQLCIYISLLMIDNCIIIPFTAVK